MKLAKDLVPLKAKAIAFVNARAQRSREALSSPGAAHAEKLEEVLAVFDGLSPDKTRILKAEAEIRGIDARDLANLILEKVREARRATAAIEIERQRRLAAIAAARSPAEIEAVTSEPWTAV